MRRPSRLASWAACSAAAAPRECCRGVRVTAPCMYQVLVNAPASGVCLVAVRIESLAAKACVDAAL